MSDPVSQIGDVLKTILAAIGLGAGAVKGARMLFAYRTGDIPVCTTRVVHESLGLPWNRQIAIHPLADGRLEITALRAPEEGAKDNDPS